MKHRIIAAALCLCTILACASAKLSNKTWSTAFQEMHQMVAQSYPFLAWKNINADSLYDVTSTAIQKAQNENDPKAYYTALRRYTFSLADNHAFIADNDFGLREQNISGSYGLGILKLDEGRYIVHYLAESGPAAQAGIKWGAVISRWNDADIDNAVNSTSILWAERPKSTSESRFLEKCRYLTRAPLGSTASVTFTNPDDGTEKTVTLTTYDDELADLANSSTCRNNSESAVKSRIDYKILPQNIGYIRIDKFMPSLIHWSLYGKYKKALEKMIDANVQGIIIDVRGNQGGLDAAVPKMCGHFVQDTSVYEYVSYFDETVDSFVIDPKATLMITPQGPYYSGTILVLIDNNTISTGEGMPLVMKRLDNGHVMGQYGTAGAFAVGSLPTYFRMPESVVIGYLPGRSLDADKHIQIDSDGQGNGGVQPDIRLPITYETAYRQYHEHEDVILGTAIRYIETGKI